MLMRSVSDMIDNVPYGLVDTHGQIHVIEGEIYKSSAMPGCVVIEIELGALYVDEDDKFEIVEEKPSGFN